jgi:thioredoxin:protein disulfide reductase
MIFRLELYLRLMKPFFAFYLLLICFIRMPVEAGLKGITLPDASNFSFPSSASSRLNDPVTLNPFISHSAIQPGEEFLILCQFSMGPEWHIYGHEETIGTRTRFVLLSDEFEVIEQKLSPSSTEIIQIGDKKITSYFLSDSSYVAVRLRLKDSLITGPNLDLNFEIDYQPCTRKVCLMKKSQKFSFPIKIGMSQMNKSNPFQARLISDLVSSVNKSSKPQGELDDSIEKILTQGSLAALFLAFLWGIAASLTPCVYPMIPITVSLFTRDQSKGFSARFFNALIYVLGIALVYAVLGTLTSYTGRDLGSWLAEPIVVIPIVMVMTALALSLFGLFEFDLPYTLKEKLNQVEGNGALGLFLMGGAMGFVAAPCVGPFAGAIILWLVKNPGSPVFGFLLMASFGLGLGVLFLVIALFSQSILPKSGAWMIRTKKIMGYAVLGMAYYFLEILIPEQISKTGWGIYWVIGGGLLGGFSVLSWEEPWWKKVSKSLGILAFILGTLLILQSNGILKPQPIGTLSQSTSESQIYNSHDTALRIARKKARPAFLYFGAKWCIPCRHIKAVVLQDPRVVEELKRFIVVHLDCTQSDSPAAKIKDKLYKSPSMPFFAFYDSQGKHRKELSIHGAVDIKTLVAQLKKVP